MPHLPDRILMLVTDRHLAAGEDALVDAVAEAVEGGVNAVQLRERDLDTNHLSHLAERLSNSISRGGATGRRPPTSDRHLLIVNSDTTVARNTGALHLPEDAPYTRPDGVDIVGRSVHSVHAAKRAAAEGADYLVVGSIFETPSHPHEPPLGLHALSEIVAAVQIPVIAIGGITAERVPGVLNAGASGVAVISAILSADSPRNAAAALREALDAEVLERR